MNIINFSGGRTSAYMTKRLIDEGLSDYIVTFQNTGKEMPATLDFINECDRRWGLNVVWLEYRYGNSFEVVTYETASRTGRPFDEAIEYNKGHLPNTMQRWCTRMLKIETLHKYLKSLGHDPAECTFYNGIRYDEPRRWGKARDNNFEMPLVNWGIRKPDVLEWWANQPFQLMLNEPYGNCDGCFLKGKGKLAIIAKEKPELLEWWIDKENETGNTFKREITYRQILEKSQAQLGLWDDDSSFECFCNVD